MNAPEVTPKVTPEVDNVDISEERVHKIEKSVHECAACKKKDELIKLLKEEVGFAERGYTKRNDV